jgi:hypothetical protein
VVDEREIRPGDYMVDMDGHLCRVLRVGADTGCASEASERHPQADAERREGEGSRDAA